MCTIRKCLRIVGYILLDHCITSKTITLVFFAIEVFTLYETLLLYYQAFLSQSAPLAEQHAGGD